MQVCTQACGKTSVDLGHQEGWVRAVEHLVADRHHRAPDQGGQGVLRGRLPVFLRRIRSSLPLMLELNSRRPQLPRGGADHA
jgi:hypothetical protein